MGRLEGHPHRPEPRKQTDKPEQSDIRPKKPLFCHNISRSQVADEMVLSHTVYMAHDLQSNGLDRPNWIRVWRGLLGLWATFVVVGTLLNYETFLTRHHPISWFRALSMNLVSYGIWALLLTPVVLLCCANFPLTRRGLIKLVPAHGFAIFGSACIDVGIKTLAGGRIYPGAQSHPFPLQFTKYFFSEAEADIQIYLLIAVIGYVVAYYTELRDREKLAGEMNTSLVRARLQVLKMQLEPHFLFNTLHFIAALVRTEPRAAERMICSLGDLLRKTLEADDSSVVPLWRELDFLNSYLDIQRTRFRDRLRTEIDVQDEILGESVPYLLLQPLVENAIKHGIARMAGPGRIEISIRKHIDCLQILVANDCGAPEPSTSRTRLGIGLENICTRMRILYGAMGSVELCELPGNRFQVGVKIPLDAGMASTPDPRERSFSEVMMGV